MTADKQASRFSGKDRRDELVQIAYRKIAERGFEGLRIRDVASEAGINNATLHYYFPTKEELIQGVVDKLIHEFSIPRGLPAVEHQQSALEAIRAEFEDGRHRLYEDPDQFVVFTELMIRSRRDPAIARVFTRLDNSWRSQLMAVIERGIQSGEFRLDLEPEIIATALMAEIKGVGFQMLGETNLTTADRVFAQILMQAEQWLTGKTRQAPNSAHPPQPEN